MYLAHTSQQDFELPRPTGSVLIVDDEMLIRWALCQSLQRLGYNATAAPSGQEAREQIKKRTFDFILIDVKLPGSDGFTIAEEFHRLSPESQVVLMTAYDSDELKERAARLGFSCVQKPFNIEHLSEILGS